MNEAASTTSNRARRAALAHQYLPVPALSQSSVGSSSSTSPTRGPAASSDLDSSKIALNGTTAPVSSEQRQDPPDLHHVPFGSRLLSNPDDVYSHNAWDHVVPPPEWEDDVRARLEVQREGMVDSEKRDAYNARPASYWDKFYQLNTNRFFKDRNWLRLEFGELMRCAEEGAGPKKVVEIGCGAGNTVFPLLATNENPELEVWACDYSWKAVEVVKENALYPVPPHGKGRLHASVWDVTRPPLSSQNLRPDHESIAADTNESTIESSLPEGVEPESIDIAIMIFVMSALHPDEWKRAVANVWKMLKPNGLLFIRDYGRFDLAQIRIKRGRMLGENFYIRGDGTRVYFFEASELSEMLTGDKDAYIPAEPIETIVEVELPVPSSSGEAGTETSPDGLEQLGERERERIIASASESPMPPGTPVGGEEDVAELGAQLEKLDTSSGIASDGETEGKDEVLVEARSGVKYKKGEPLSTRFVTPTSNTSSFQTTPTPRVEFQLHQTPTVEGATPLASTDPINDVTTQQSGPPAFDPFSTPHSELGVPDHPLFVIDQLGVDRRMLVNRKEQLKMYRIWMQVKARKVAAAPEPGVDTSEQALSQDS